MGSEAQSRSEGTLEVEGLKVGTKIASGEDREDRTMNNGGHNRSGGRNVGVDNTRNSKKSFRMDVSKDEDR